MIVLAFVNQKGGVGKTSCCFHLGGELSARGARVLLVDNDPQASLTHGFYGVKESRNVLPLESIHAAYERPARPCSVFSTTFPRLSIVRGHLSIGQFNTVVDDRLLEIDGTLKQALESWSASFDWCLIDNPPNLHRLTFEAMLAADAILCPLQPEDFGSQGTVGVRRLCRYARAKGIEIPWPRYIVNMKDRRLRLHNDFEAQLRQSLGANLLEQNLPSLADFKEAILERKPVSIFRPNGAAAGAVRALASEIEELVSHGHAASMLGEREGGECDGL